MADVGKTIMAGIRNGVMLSLLFSLTNGLSTWVLTDDAGVPITLEDWANARVA
jgi:hypothetical protein